MISVNNSHLYVSAKSHAGMSGKNNEDRFAVTAYQLNGTDPTPVVFAIVSDGIGGHQAGETAAEIAVETITEDVAYSDGSHPILTLQEAIIHASSSILAESESDGQKKGMGATCACAWVIGDQLYTATVGDSRIYLVRGESIQQISTDHTWVQEAIGAGLLSPEEARTHPNAHVIRRHLGSAQMVEPDVRLKLSAGEDDAQSLANQGFRLKPKDQLLLCSDGLTDLVDDHEIYQHLQAKDPERGIEALIHLANQRGGHDNITVVVLGVPEAVSQTKPLPEKSRPARKKQRLLMPCLVSVFIIMLLVTALLAAGYYAYSQYFMPTQIPAVTTSIEATLPAQDITGSTTTHIPAPTELPASSSSQMPGPNITESLAPETTTNPSISATP